MVISWYSGEIVGYAMSERMTKDLVMQALFRAVSRRLEPTSEARPDSAYRSRLAILFIGLPENRQAVRHARVDEPPRQLLR